MENVRDVTVRGEKNPLLGNIVTATFNLSQPESLDSLKRRVHEFCKGKLAAYKIPARIKISDSPKFNARFKKARGAEIPT
jgi:hypothetical protein